MIFVGTARRTLMSRFSHCTVDRIKVDSEIGVSITFAAQLPVKLCPTRNASECCDVPCRPFGHSKDMSVSYPANSKSFFLDSSIAHVSPICNTASPSREALAIGTALDVREVLYSMTRDAQRLRRLGMAVVTPFLQFLPRYHHRFRLK